MKFYVSTALRNAAQAGRLAEALESRESRGHELTNGWMRRAAEEGADIAGMAGIAAAEMDGVMEADAVMVVLPGERGTHAELGMALAAGKPVVL